MVYNADMTWDAWVQKLERHGRPFVHSLLLGNELWADWQSYRDGRDNATIGLSISRSEADIAALDAAFAALKALHDAADNQVVAQADHLFALRKLV